MSPSEREAIFKTKRSMRALLSDYLPKQKVRAVIIVHQGWAKLDNWPALRVSYQERGFELYEISAASRPIGNKNGQLSLHEQFLTTCNMVNKQYNGIPLFLVGIGAGSLVVANVIGRTPISIHGAILCDMPRLHLVEIILARTLLRWERFRLGSDVPSRFLAKFAEKCQGFPLTIGAAQELLHLDFKLLSAPFSRYAIIRSTHCLNLKTTPYEKDLKHNLNALNQILISKNTLAWLDKRLD